LLVKLGSGFAVLAVMLIVIVLTDVFVVVDAPLASEYANVNAVMLSARMALDPLLLRVQVIRPVALLNV
jgi:hypothetical protein